MSAPMRELLNVERCLYVKPIRAQGKDDFQERADMSENPSPIARPGVLYRTKWEMRAMPSPFSHSVIPAEAGIQTAAFAVLATGEPFSLFPPKFARKP